MNQHKRIISIGLLFIFMSYLLIGFPNNMAQSFTGADDILTAGAIGVHDHTDEKDDLKKVPSLLFDSAAIIVLMTTAAAAIFLHFLRNTRIKIFMTPYFYQANSISVTP
ncbi:hypothetical protein [Cytobacillus gottheilii]|uniref:hypothetical protein n=1 Tax=Cytobacillus gottheilii TaxID=859144 RepID=UPI0009BB465E|nr:hypothetical protein [Cytobacillus gottheilii]